MSSAAVETEDLWDLGLCTLCGKVISRFTQSRRQEHVNRCCDQYEAMRLVEAPPQAPPPPKGTCFLSHRGSRSEGSSAVTIGSETSMPTIVTSSPFSASHRLRHPQRAKLFEPTHTNPKRQSASEGTS